MTLQGLQTITSADVERSARAAVRALTTARYRYVPSMFKRTITARMLRHLCSVERMLQADFMRLYHVICARPGKTAPSSFACNFSRFTRYRLHCMEQRQETNDAMNDTGRLSLLWVGHSPETAVRVLTDKALQSAYENLESELMVACTSEAPEDHIGDAATWLARVRAEIARRTA